MNDRTPRPVGASTPPGQAGGRAAVDQPAATAGSRRRSPGRELAVQTRRGSSPSTHLLLPPSAPHRALIEDRTPLLPRGADLSDLNGPGATWGPPEIGADPRFARDGRVRAMRGYDEGLPPPPLPPGTACPRLQAAGVEEVLAALDQGTRLVTTACRDGGPESALPLPTPVLRGVLQWLTGFPGQTWEQRWLTSGADAAPGILADTLADARVRRRLPGSSAQISAPQVTSALAVLLVGRVLRPSYSWLLGWRSNGKAYRSFWLVNEPAAWARLQQLPAWRSGLPRHRRDAEEAVARVMIRSGKRCEDLRGEDLLHYADVVHTSGRARREHLAWELLVALGPFADEPATMRAAWSAKGNSRRHSAVTLVHRYGMPASPVRDLLVDYLGELQPTMDYNSLETVAYRLARLFWHQVLTLNPNQADLQLDAATAAAWRASLEVTMNGRPRRDVHSTLFTVRAFYRDLAEWSHEEPARWGPWVAPCPVSRHESRRASVAKRRQQERSQARTRALTPLLPTLLAAAATQKLFAERLHAAVTDGAPGQRITVDGVTVQPIAAPAKASDARAGLWAHLIDPGTGAPLAPFGLNRPRHPDPGLVAWPQPFGPLAPGAARTQQLGWVDRRLRLEYGLVNVTRMEDDAFWAWAIVETLRLTGLRREELAELTQLSLRHYRAPASGTLVPLLHVAPSKNDRERLIPMSPELVTVLLAVQRRVKALTADGAVPLTIRYDSNEKVHGQPLPHLFVHRVGTRLEVVSTSRLMRLLRELAALADLRDPAQPDQPVTFTPHDFRRLFTTELVGAGLPLHIAATLLGHLSLETTRGYTAVFPEHVIIAHEALIERRRRLRADAEMRPATGEQWDDFQQHFLRRKVALGDCHRPYGTPCVHEHACVKCRFLAVDPAAAARIEEMTTNTCDRIREARDRGWLGELTILEEQLAALRGRSTELAARRAPEPANAETRGPGVP